MHSLSACALAYSQYYPVIKAVKKKRCNIYYHLFSGWKSMCQIDAYGQIDDTAFWFCATFQCLT